MTSQNQTELWQMHDDAIKAAKIDGRTYSGRYSRHTFDGANNKTKELS